MANLYDLKKFDLNLLVIFECIYQLDWPHESPDSWYHLN